MDQGAGVMCPDLGGSRRRTGQGPGVARGSRKVTRCPRPPGSAPPPRSLASWLTSRGLGRAQDETTACIPHDIYVIGTQENSLGDREWVEFLRASLKTLMAIDYRVVTGTRWAPPSPDPAVGRAAHPPPVPRRSPCSACGASRWWCW